MHRICVAVCMSIALSACTSTNRVREGPVRTVPTQDIIAEAAEADRRQLVYELVLNEDQGQFKFGRSDLPDEARSELDRLVGQLRADPKGVFIEIEGHTDNVGGADDNERIGLQRAEAVKRYLYEQHDVPLHKINVISYGEEKPVAPNNSREGRALNRRVVVKVFASAAEAMPQFPWPPEQWTTRHVLPASLLALETGGQLGDSFDRLADALKRAAIFEWSAFAVGLDGFAVVSRVENIDDHGRPGNPRWGTHVPSRAFSIREYLKALFMARPGRYRVIVFVVTSRPIVSTGKPPDRSKMETLLRSGAGSLPRALRNVALAEGAIAEALVYEFYRASEDEPARLVTDSTLQGVDHLVGSGVWTESELRQ